jgi:hypothetical protein
MSEFANNMRVGLAKRSFVTSFKVALRKPKVAEFSRHLEQAKTTLLLAINVASFMIEFVVFEVFRKQTNIRQRTLL